MELLTRRNALAVLSVVVLTGCVPDFDVDETVIVDQQILAISATPAEAAAADGVVYRALVVSPDGTITDATLTWKYCADIKPQAELGPVSARCVEGDPEATVAIPAAEPVTAMMPFETCRYFGPDSPPTTTGEAGRPADPDVTGGYRQPVRVALGDSVSFYEHRIACGLAGATQEQSADFRRRSRRNANPRIDDLFIVRADGVEVATREDEPVSLAPGEAIELIVRWPECPTEAVCGDDVCLPDENADDCREDCRLQRTCKGAETYITFDPLEREIVTRREAMRVAWVATRAGLEVPRTGVLGDDDATESRNRFVAPSVPGVVTVYVVLRDERGGTTWQTLQLEVEP